MKGKCYNGEVRVFNKFLGRILSAINSEMLNEAKKNFQDRREKRFAWTKIEIDFLPTKKEQTSANGQRKGYGTDIRKGPTKNEI